jgi:hypothetical protein
MASTSNAIVAFDLSEVVPARQDMYQKTRFAISSSVLIAGTSLKVGYELISTAFHFQLC